MAQTLIAQDAWPQLVTVFEEIAALTPNDPRAHYNLASALHHAKRHEDARRALLQALSLQPGYPLALQLLPQVERACEAAAVAPPPSPAEEEPALLPVPPVEEADPKVFSIGAEGPSPAGPPPVEVAAASAPPAPAPPAPPPGDLAPVAETLSPAPAPTAPIPAEEVETEWIPLADDEPLPAAAPASAAVAAPPAQAAPGAVATTAPESLPTVADFPVAEMNVRAGVAIWAMLSLLMMIFADIYSVGGIGQALFLLVIVFACYVVAVVWQVHGKHAWITPNTADPAEHRLLRLLRSAADKAKLPLPNIALASRESDINAWTYGLGRNHAFVIVTGGLLEHVQPTDDELEAVLAHELSHVHHGDSIVSTLLGFPLWIIHKIRSLMTWVLETALRFLPLAAQVGRGALQVSAEVGGEAGCYGYLMVIMMLVAFAVFMIYLGLAIAAISAVIFVAILILNAFSREREYLADLYAAQVMGSTKPMQSGLVRLGLAIGRVDAEIKRRAETTPEGSPVDTNVAAPEVGFSGQEVGDLVDSAVATKPTWHDLIRECLDDHPATRHRVYFLRHPHERRLFWSRLFGRLEKFCGRFISYRPQRDHLDPAAAWLIGAVPGLVLGVLPVLSTHWIVDVVALLSFLAAGVLLGRRSRAQRWSPGAFAGGLTVAAFSAATVLLVIGAALLNPLAVAFPAAFLLAVILFGVSGLVAVRV
jgi:heat shock protein HtpX